MKDEIQKILDASKGIVNYIPIPLIMEELAADELTALMCYEATKAFIAGRGGDGWLNDVCDYLEIHGYSEGDILQAIERVKNEQK